MKVIVFLRCCRPSLSIFQYDLKTSILTLTVLGFGIARKVAVMRASLSIQSTG